MERSVQEAFDARHGEDKEAAYEALVKLFELAEHPVGWAYEVWDGLVADLKHHDAHQRAFAAQMLCRLAISDPEGRLMKDFPALAGQMHDPESFVAARHTVQSLWRVGLAGPAQAELAVKALEARFLSCGGEKNAHLIRTDLLTSLGELAKAVADAGPMEAVAQALMKGEPDEKAQKKQAAAWRKARR